VFCRSNPLKETETSNTKGERIFRYDLVRKLLDTPTYLRSVTLLSSFRFIKLFFYCDFFFASVNRNPNLAIQIFSLLDLCGPNDSRTTDRN
jgi:hypothetical protein